MKGGPHGWLGVSTAAHSTYHALLTPPRSFRLSQSKGTTCHLVGQMSTYSSEKKPLGPIKPALILHGGAGAITRANLPPSLYSQYHASLLKYLTTTKAFLDSGSSALDAACRAVSLMEDDPLFNCGRGSVFTIDGGIEMEASVMVASINADDPLEGKIKRGAAVSLVRNTRHPILLAREVLVDADEDRGLGGTNTMHCHLSGKAVEEWGWEKGLERKDNEWFWTKRRWEEHRRGLKREEELKGNGGQEELPSQGTVGAVCVDSRGNLAVATSTGGLTNKASGRIGDTPTIGGGFWAESWDEQYAREDCSIFRPTLLDAQNIFNQIIKPFTSCIPSLFPGSQGYLKIDAAKMQDDPAGAIGTGRAAFRPPFPPSLASRPRVSRRAVAMSGTGNGDSFLRTNAVRTAAAICRLSPSRIPLSSAITAIAGKGGELQRSAGDRWEKTGEGQGGIIGIEALTTSPRTVGQQTAVDVSFDFNCGGLWRAYYRTDPDTKIEVPVIRVFRGEY
jgi:L-asparaginase